MGGCNCKNNQLKRAKNLLNGRTWEQLNDVEQGQISGLYYDRHKKYGTEEQLIHWVR